MLANGFRRSYSPPVGRMNWAAVFTVDVDGRITKGGKQLWGPFEQEARTGPPAGVGMSERSGVRHLDVMSSQ